MAADIYPEPAGIWSGNSSWRPVRTRKDADTPVQVSTWRAPEMHLTNHAPRNWIVRPVCLLPGPLSLYTTNGAPAIRQRLQAH